MILGKKRPGFESMMPGYGGQSASMPQDMAMPETAQMGGGGAAPKKSGGIDWKNVLVNALGGAADGAARFFGGGPVFAQMQAQQQQLQAQAAQEQQARLQQVAQQFAAQRLGFSADETTALGGKLQDAVANRLKPDSVPAIQQNADYIRRTRGDAAADAYIENFGRSPETPTMLSVPGGPTLFGKPSEFMPTLQGMGYGQGGGNRPAIGATVSMSQLGGAPTMQNTPAPQTNAQGDPVSLTRAQYQAIVAEMGQSETDAYLRRNNIRVR
jgi:hypothetical protein